MRPVVVVVDDDPAMVDVLVEVLSEQGMEVCPFTRPQEALAQLRGALGARAAALVADLTMPGLDGLTLCQEALRALPDLPVILITGFGSMEAAIGAIRAGAFDFLPKPFDPEALAQTVARAVSQRALRQALQAIQASPVEGGSPAMAALQERIARVAGQEVTVLIRGETGAGKERVARAIHAQSARADKPFVAVNCAAIPESLWESELFGHVRGAFTDARQPRRGLLFEADGGTLLLDEVGELPLSVQPKLLRALQERQARPVGADRELPFSVRVVAATHRDLARDVQEGRFRADLYYRLQVVELVVPPLRERGEDVLRLAHGFLAAAAARSSRPPLTITPAVAERLMAWHWPGNVRELENAMERAAALARSGAVAVEDLPEAIQRGGAAPRGAAREAAALSTLEEVERQHILRVLAEVGGSKAQAARVLGVDRVTLYRKLERYSG